MYADAIQNDEQINRLIASLPHLRISDDATATESRRHLNGSAGPHHPTGSAARISGPAPRTFSATLEDHMDPAVDAIIATSRDIEEDDSVLEGMYPCAIKFIIY